MGWNCGLWFGIFFFGGGLGWEMEGVWVSLWGVGIDFIVMNELKLFCLINLWEIEVLEVGGFLGVGFFEIFFRVGLGFGCGVWFIIGVVILGFVLLDF